MHYKNRNITKGEFRSSVVMSTLISDGFSCTRCIIIGIYIYIYSDAESHFLGVTYHYVYNRQHTYTIIANDVIPHHVISCGMVSYDIVSCEPAWQVGSVRLQRNMNSLRLKRNAKSVRLKKKVKSVRLKRKVVLRRASPRIV